MNVLMVIAPAGFREEEYTEPRQALESAGHRVSVASTKAGACSGAHGGRAEAELALGDVKAADYDAVVFVGGPGATCFFDDARAHDLARDLQRAGKLVSAICIAPVTLARAGVLAGHRATVFSSEREQLTAAGVKLQAADVVSDGNLVTANGPAAAKKFGQRLVEVLAGR